MIAVQKLGCKCSKLLLLGKTRPSKELHVMAEKKITAKRKPRKWPKCGRAKVASITGKKISIRNC